MAAATDRSSAEIVPLGEARAARAARAPDLDSAGAMLQAAREEAGLSLDAICEDTNLRRERLEAIEAMDLSALPAPAYTLGFVRTYADHLGLPSEPLVARFREEAGWVRSVTAPKIPNAPRPRSDRQVGLIGVLVVLLFAVWAIWQIVGRTPPEDAALPPGYPIADRSETTAAVPEVTTNLGNDPVLPAETAPGLEASRAVQTAQAAEVPAEAAAQPPASPIVTPSPAAGGPAIAEGDAAATPTRPAVIRERAVLTDPVPPVYPRRCQDGAAAEEVVIVRFAVSRSGRATSPSVENSTNACFEEAALAAVSRFGFAPATENGLAVAESARSTRVVFQKP